MTGVRIYIEGGGDGAGGKQALRQGFDEFFRELKREARQKRLAWQSVPCGGRQQAYDQFRHAVDHYHESFVVLLVDSEGPVQDSPWAHLSAQQMPNPSRLSDDQAQFMIEAMEAWIASDPEVLTEFYGQRFLTKKIPHNPEQTDRHRLARELTDATRPTQKGEYHKIHHASKLLALVRPPVVRAKSSSCERTFSTLERKIRQTNPSAPGGSAG